MERVESLINKLALQLQSRASAAELLHTTELLQAALKGATAITPVSVNAGVAVWLPAGYTGTNNRTVAQSLPAAPVETPQQVVLPPAITIAPEPVFSTQWQDGKPVLQHPSVAPMPENVALQSPRVPLPPRVVALPMVEEVVSLPVDATEPSEFDPGNVFTLDVTYEEDELAQMQEPAKQEKATAPAEAPVAIEKPGTVSAKPFPQYPDAATLMKNIFPLAPDPMPPAREVNQLVPDSSAIPLNERLMEKKVELAEVLSAGPKITDLRKAFTINDKYQMINALFRGDEDMFERSVRTLNNFGSLPEARFWMQRELIVKLGWNEKDEMPQHFQKLVNRRFA